MTGRVPVIAITGHLGAGKTTLLNHLLRAPGARIGVIVNDFGALNVDAALTSGQVDEVAGISGGCLCCLPNAGGLDETLKKLAHPRLRLDAIVVEASGAADPVALARLLHFSAVDGIRFGGIVEVIDAVEHFRTVDTWPDPPMRYAAATLVVIGKTDLLSAGERERRIERIGHRVRQRNPDAQLVVVQQGRIDPALLFDTANPEDPEDELPIAALLREEHHDHGRHEHARAAAVAMHRPVAPGALIDLLEEPPEGAYRIKGRVRVRGTRTERGYVVNVVGQMVHVAPLPEPPALGELVAIGIDLDQAAAQRRLETAAEAPSAHPDAAGLRRLRRYQRLSR